MMTGTMTMTATMANAASDGYAKEMGMQRREAGRARVDEQAAWTAVLARDGRQDGRFFYAVTTTGVYCRPSCPSRRPRRDNVAFFADVDAAERAGYRACLRCKPRAPLAPTLAIIERARTFIDAHLDEGVSLRALAAETGLSLFHVQRRFKQVVGLTPRQYLAARRAERFKTHLKKGRSVTDATYEAGYGSSSRVYESSNATLGMTPSAYKRGGAGVHIRYATADSPFGRLLVGVTARGICAVMLGEHDEALERSLAEEYPSAQRERAPQEIESVVRDVLARLDGLAAPQGRGVAPRATGGPSSGAASGMASEADLPLDLQGTEFTWRVWRALQAIPYGETRSYSEVAQAIGAPRAVRAVARACATNPAALVIPCHRVIGSTGALTGYRWGVDRKRRILEHEREHASESRTAAATNAGTGASRRVSSRNVSSRDGASEAGALQTGASPAGAAPDRAAQGSAAQRSAPQNGASRAGGTHVGGSPAGTSRAGAARASAANGIAPSADSSRGASTLVGASAAAARKSAATLDASGATAVATAARRRKPAAGR